MTGKVILAGLCGVVLAGCAATTGEVGRSGAGTAAVAATEEGRRQAIDRFFERSGLARIVELLPDQVAMGFDQQPPPPVGREEYLAFRKALIDAFDPQRVTATLKRHIDQNYDAGKMARVLAMLEDPLGRKMTELELEAQTPQAQMEMMQMGNIIMGQATPKRMALVQRLDEVTGASQFSLDMQMTMAEVTMRNLNRIVPAAQRIPPEQMEQMLQQMRMQSVYPVRQGTRLNMIYAYRSVTDEELERYIELNETDYARWMTEVMNGAWKAVTRQAAEDLSEQINRTILNQRAL